MVKARYEDRDIVVEILTKAFDKNKGVHFFGMTLDTKDNEPSEIDWDKLIKTAFDLCYSCGEIFLSDDKNTCALILLPDTETSSIKSLLLDITLVFQPVNGFSNLKNVLSVARKNKAICSKIPISYQSVISFALNTGFLVFNGLLVRHLSRNTWQHPVKKNKASSALKVRKATMEQAFVPLPPIKVAHLTNEQQSPQDIFESNCILFRLTETEIVVAKHYCAGLKRQHITEILLFNSARSFDFHLENICKKTGVKKTKGSPPRRTQLIQKLTQTSQNQGSIFHVSKN